MKLYTEERVINALTLAHSHIISLQNIIDRLTPIELPSDEEIGQEFKSSSENWEVRQALEVGAKWMKDKIQGGNK